MLLSFFLQSLIVALSHSACSMELAGCPSGYETTACSCIATNPCKPYFHFNGQSTCVGTCPLDGFWRLEGDFCLNIKNGSLVKIESYHVMKFKEAECSNGSNLTQMVSNNGVSYCVCC